MFRVENITAMELENTGNSGEYNNFLKGLKQKLAEIKEIADKLR